MIGAVTTDDLILLRERRRRQATAHLAPREVVRPDPVAWIEANFYIPETRAPLQLAPYQRDVLARALATDKDGRYHYSTILWGDIKKSAKSTIAAAVAMYIAATTEWGSVYIVANDLKQADSRVGYYIRRAIQLHPELRHTVEKSPFLSREPKRSNVATPHREELSF